MTCLVCRLDGDVKSEAPRDLAFAAAVAMGVFNGLYAEHEGALHSLFRGASAKPTVGS
jgi:hypothetical protein